MLKPNQAFLMNPVIWEILLWQNLQKNYLFTSLSAMLFEKLNFYQWFFIDNINIKSLDLIYVMQPCYNTALSRITLRPKFKRYKYFLLAFYEYYMLISII